MWIVTLQGSIGDLFQSQQEEVLASQHEYSPQPTRSSGPASDHGSIGRRLIGGWRERPCPQWRRRPEPAKAALDAVDAARGGANVVAIQGDPVMADPIQPPLRLGR